MKSIFDPKKEEILLNKIQMHFGLEVFTPGLERSRPLYHQFIQDFKLKNIKIITIAGTNGKGQTTHTLGHSITSNNIKVAWWTSPHILSIRERFNFMGEDISYEALNQLIDESLPLILKLEFKVSFYEFLFYVFLKWISKKDLNYLLLEVGLGGKFDAVNHFDADYAVITSISRDHQAILGNTYKKILYEKLGITRDNGILITSFKLQFLLDEVKNYAKTHNIEYFNLMPDSDYYSSNIRLASFIVEKLGFKTLDLENLPKFKGREEYFKWKNLFFHFIGAHNPDGVRETVNRINKNKKYFDILLISFSKRDFADVNLMLKTITEYISPKSLIKLCVFDHPKAINLKILEDVQKMLCHNRNVELIYDWKFYIDECNKNSRENKFLVMGSYYFIGEVQSYLLSN